MKRFCSIILALLLAACSHHRPQSKLPYYNTPDFTPVWLTDNDAIKAVHAIPAFQLTDQVGNRVSETTVKGKIYIANFFFTACGSVCPRMMGNLAKVQAAFARDTNVMILSHTVTPDLDSVAVLNRYAAKHSIKQPQWRLLTGNKDTIYHLARKAYFADEQQGFYRGTNDFLHTENMVLIDREGHIRGVYNGTLALETDHLIEHIRILENENLNR